MKQLFGMIALSTIIKNGDAHLKNFAILYDRPSVNVRLAPVYDMLSTVAYDTKDAMALEIDGSKAYPSRKQLIQFARQSCGLSNQNAELILADTSSGVKKTIAEIKEYAANHQDFQHNADRLIKLFSKGLKNIENNGGDGAGSGTSGGGRRLDKK